MLQTLREKAYTLLRHTERYTKTDMVYLAKGGSALGIGQAVSSLAAFLLSIAFANLFPKEAYGTYRYVLSVIGVIGAFSLTGMDAAIAQAVARGLDGTLRKGFREMFLWTLGTAALALAVGVYYFLNDNATLGWSLLIAALAMPLLKSARLYNGFLIGKREFARKALYDALYDVIPAAAIAGALALSHSPVVVLGTYFISYAVVASALYRRTASTHDALGPADENVTRFSFHLSAMNVVGTISSQIDKVLTFHYLGAIQLAIYAFALALPQQLRQIQKHIATLILPKFSASSFEAIRASVGRKALLLFLAMTVIALAYIASAPFIFDTFFPRYAESVRYSQLFSLVLLTAPSMLFKQALIAHKRTRELYAINTTLPIIKIAALLIFVPRFGIIGAILTLIVTEVAGVFCSMIAFYRSRHISRGSADKLPS